jgi:3-deoxy-D-manno-octulosonic-acid transferase
VWNFAELYQTLDEGGGTVAVADGAALLGQMRRWLTDPRARQRSSEAGLRMVEASGGALDRTLAVLEPYLLQLRIEGDAAYA